MRDRRTAELAARRRAGAPTITGENSAIVEARLDDLARPASRGAPVATSGANLPESFLDALAEDRDRSRGPGQRTRGFGCRCRHGELRSQNSGFFGRSVERVCWSCDGRGPDCVGSRRRLSGFWSLHFTPVRNRGSACADTSKRWPCAWVFTLSDTWPSARTSRHFAIRIGSCRTRVRCTSESPFDYREAGAHLSARNMPETAASRICAQVHCWPSCAIARGKRWDARSFSIRGLSRLLAEGSRGTQGTLFRSRRSPVLVQGPRRRAKRCSVSSAKLGNAVLLATGSSLGMGVDVKGEALVDRRPSTSCRLPPPTIRC